MDKVERAEFAKNNKMLVTGHDWDDHRFVVNGKRICVWSLEGGSWFLSSTINEEWRSFDVTRSGNLIASGYESIHLWNPESGEQFAVHRGHNYPIDSLRFSFQEDRLVSTEPLTLRIWDTTQKALLHASFDITNSFYSLAYAPSGKYIAASVFGNETGIHLFDGKNRSHLAIFIGCIHCAKSLSFSADNSLLASYLG